MFLLTAIYYSVYVLSLLDKISLDSLVCNNRYGKLFYCLFITGRYSWYIYVLYEPSHQKTNNLHMPKQRCTSAVQILQS